jgi:hypothetical protein
MHNELENKLEGLHPVVAIASAVGISLIMVVTTFTMFIHSGAYKTVKQIQVGSQLTAASLGGSYDVTSPVNAVDISNYEVILKQKLSSIDNQADFSESALSPQALGLPSN